MTRINKNIDNLKWYNKPIPYIGPILTFIGFGFLSIVIGLIGGFQLWIWSGATPDTSGGTGIFLYVLLFVKRLDEERVYESPSGNCWAYIIICIQKAKAQFIA